MVMTPYSPPEAAKRFGDFYGENVPSQASLAVRYAASLERVAVVLSGMSDLAQLEDNTAYMEDFVPLAPGEKVLAEELAAILKKAIKVPCTGCRYCTEVCPMNIAIPDYFGLLNLYAVTGKKTNMYYQRYILNHGLASHCIQCGQCEGNCPQHIEIRAVLKEFAALYENN